MIKILVVLLLAFAVFAGIEAHQTAQAGENMGGNDGSETFANLVKSNHCWLAVGIIAVIIAILLFFLSLAGVFADSDTKAAKADTQTETEAVVDEPAEDPVEETTTTDCCFYNNQLQNDSNNGNNYNFGYDRYAAAESSGENITEWLNADFKESIRKDPALAAATMAYADAIMGTRFMGEFYDSAKEDWSKTMNNAKDQFIKDPELWQSKVDSFIEAIEETATVKVGKVNNFSDQMYMNPYTGSDVPDIIAMITDNHNGHYLSYTFTIKGDDSFVVNYRCECGYQPTDVVEVMDITPVTKTKVGGKGDGPSKPDPKKPTPKKDPSKDPANQGNAPIGGGKNKPTDGTGDYQPTKPSKDSGSNAGGNSSGGSSGNNGGSGNSGGSAPETKPIPVHNDSHDNGSSGAGNNNGEFVMK